MNKNILLKLGLTSLTLALLTPVTLSLLDEPTWARSKRTQQQLRSCQLEVKDRFPNIPLNTIEVYQNGRDSQNNLIVIWDTNRRRTGYCIVNEDGEVIQFDDKKRNNNNNSNNRKNSNYQEFRNISDVGNVKVDRNSYSGGRGYREFNVVINDQKDNVKWIANCDNWQLFRGQQPVVSRDQNSLRRISQFVCQDNSFNR